MCSVQPYLAVRTNELQNLVKISLLNPNIQFNSLPNDKILGFSKFKETADDKQVWRIKIYFLRGKKMVKKGNIPVSKWSNVSFFLSKYVDQYQFPQLSQTDI